MNSLSAGAGAHALLERGSGLRAGNDIPYRRRQRTCEGPSPRRSKPWFSCVCTLRLLPCHQFGMARTAQRVLVLVNNIKNSGPTAGSR
jgi:hypothetical protein